MKLKNIWLVFVDQLPLSRMFKNFVITRNAWGLFYKSSHISSISNNPKIMYNTKVSALRAASNMNKKTGYKFSAYKCIHCNGYHIGKTRIN